MERIGPTRVRLAIEVPGSGLEPELRARAGRDESIHGWLAVVDSERRAAPFEPSAAQKAALLAHVRTTAAEHGLVPLGPTEVSDLSYGPDGTLRFTALLDVRPEVKLPDLTSVAVTVEPVLLDEPETSPSIRTWTTLPRRGRGRGTARWPACGSSEYRTWPAPCVCRS